MHTNTHNLLLLQHQGCTDCSALVAPLLRESANTHTHMMTHTHAHTRLHLKYHEQTAAAKGFAALIALLRQEKCTLTYTHTHHTQNPSIATARTCVRCTLYTQMHTIHTNAHYTHTHTHHTQNPSIATARTCIRCTLYTHMHTIHTNAHYTHKCKLTYTDTHHTQNLSIATARTCVIGTTVVATLI